MNTAIAPSPLPCRPARFSGLIAATYTPFASDGSLNLEVIEKQATHLAKNGISAAFICGTTGEGPSLTIEERTRLARRWSEVVRGTSLKLIVHVGHNSVAEARVLASDAAKCGAHAISAVAPNYFKPATVNDLVSFCASIAQAAPDLPFYYYDIPGLTGVNLSMPEFLTEARGRIPTLAGLKYSNPDLVGLQQCLALGPGLEVFYGMDEILLAALAYGVEGAVGSTYNFIAPTFHRLWAAFRRGDFVAARAEQLRSVEFVRICAGFGYLRTSKAAMSLLGVDCGPMRLPFSPLSSGEQSKLFAALEASGLFGTANSISLSR